MSEVLHVLAQICWQSRLVNLRRKIAYGLGHILRCLFDLLSLGRVMISEFPQQSVDQHPPLNTRLHQPQLAETVHRAGRLPLALSFILIHPQRRDQQFLRYRRRREVGGQVKQPRRQRVGLFFLMEPPVAGLECGRDVLEVSRRRWVADGVHQRRVGQDRLGAQFIQVLPQAHRAPGTADIRPCQMYRQREVAQQVADGFRGLALIQVVQNVIPARQQQFQTPLSGQSVHRHGLDAPPGPSGIVAVYSGGDQHPRPL